MLVSSISFTDSAKNGLKVPSSVPVDKIRGFVALFPILAVLEASYLSVGTSVITSGASGTGEPLGDGDSVCTAGFSPQLTRLITKAIINKKKVKVTILYIYYS